MVQRNAVFHPEGPSFFELARQALSSTERGYDLLAPKFDYTPFRTPDELVAPAIAMLGEVEAGIDVCCGTGAALAHLRKQCRTRAVGLDFSEGMLAEAKRRLAGPGAPVSFVRCDALTPPFEAAFDAAVTFGALGHFVGEDQPAFIRSVHRMLKPGGRFLFVTSALPPVLSARWLLSRGFNAAMHVRNAIWRPKFIMFYLTFVLPEVARQMEEAGFSVEVKDAPFPKPFDDFKVVIGTRR